MTRAPYKPRQKLSAAWRAYDKLRQQWLAAHPRSTPAEQRAAMHEIFRQVAGK